MEELGSPGAGVLLAQVSAFLEEDGRYFLPPSPPSVDRLGCPSHWVIQTHFLAQLTSLPVCRCAWIRSRGRRSMLREEQKKKKSVGCVRTGRNDGRKVDTVESLSLPTSTIVVTVRVAVLDKFSLGSPVPFLLFLCFSFTFIPRSSASCLWLLSAQLSQHLYSSCLSASFSFFLYSFTYPNVLNSDCMGTEINLEAFLDLAVS